MEMSIESLSGMTTRDKVVTAGDAVALIRDGDTIVVEGFAGHCFAEELTLALEARFLQTGSPRDLTLTFVVGQGDRQGRGFARLCYEGLLKRGIGGHWAMSPLTRGDRPRSRASFSRGRPRQLRGRKGATLGVVGESCCAKSQYRAGDRRPRRH